MSLVVGRDMNWNVVEVTASGETFQRGKVKGESIMGGIGRLGIKMKGN